jgi:hypothetical protein
MRDLILAGIFVNLLLFGVLFRFLHVIYKCVKNKTVILNEPSAEERDEITFRERFAKHGVDSVHLPDGAVMSMVGEPEPLERFRGNV